MIFPQLVLTTPVIRTYRGGFVIVHKYEITSQWPIYSKPSSISHDDS